MYSRNFILCSVAVCSASVSALALTAAAGLAQPAPEVATGGDKAAEKAGEKLAVVASVAIPAPGQTVRVGGIKEAVAERKGTDWVSGTAAITTPLPEGYPAPTPPGAIELKTYPSLRRAEFKAETNNSDIGMNVAFFPLFNHIKRRDIAMTSPVEMDYSGLSVTGKPLPAAATASKDATKKANKEASKDGEPSPDAEKPAEDAQAKAAAKPAPLKAMTMSFLYRTPELGPVGDDAKDANVKVVDTAPATYLSVGMQGGYGLNRVRMGMEQLQTFLAANPQWETVGDVRALHYNGPEKRDRDKWLEVQVQVRAAENKELKEKR